MNLGVCYYPEHWPRERWPLDAQHMREAGISIVRIAEFAWALMEPSQGKYDWTWLDEAIQVLVAEGHEIVLCTPTAAPPAWLIQSHPDILPVDEDGRRLRFGSRRHYCPNNPTFIKHTEKIVQAMAERYGNHPSVIGWQIDNEFACYIPRCYCDICAEKFREWLKEKYGTMETLNEAWGTNFWSQNYSGWAQIEPPNLTVAEPNPSHVLDYYRFFSDTWVAYQDIQISNLQSRISKHQFITHNIIASLTDIDYYDLAKNLDLISWDSYPTGYAEMGGDDLYFPGEIRPEYSYDLGDPMITGFFHSLTRGLKGAPFWIMEHQTGMINWSRTNTGVRPGALRLWTWQALASGAEAVVYFRWGASRFGLEQHHSGLRVHDGGPDVGYGDLLSMKSEQELMEKIGAEPLKASIALLVNYDDLWAINHQPHREGFNYFRYLFVFYRACQRLGLNVDLVSQEANWNEYKILLAPMAHLGFSQLAHKLSVFASQGGSVMLGIRSGFKTPSNVVTDQPLPGEFKDIVGAEVAQWHALPSGVSYPLQSEILSSCGEVTFWAESLIPEPGTNVLASYTNEPFANNAAITQKKLGKGLIYYFGIYPSLDQASTFVGYLASQHEIGLLDDLPPGLIAIARGDATLLFNFTDKALNTRIQGHDIQVAPRDLKIFNGAAL
ncbi:MAG: beta-galactosidase [Anaerolineales bacterium]|nr:beta-galactosidase [Chloroflexota bacterium]MBL6983177.1 beta-galactosidase [Anaerolineales bacterium]